MWRRAHPRVGGENVVAETKNFSRAGSSPRGRGKRCRSQRGLVSQRLIPAWAGKTRSTPAPGTGSRAHPRVGGENYGVEIELSPGYGSSPRGRGKLKGKAIVSFDAGGSSPRGRGKRRFKLPYNIPRGLIPAWAGKTPASQRASTSSAAHPRVGGENLVSGRLPTPPTGSSPRGRGKPVRDSVPGVPRRLIPAWAGKTTRSLPGFLRRWAHPRVGGENSLVTRITSHQKGSSPRGRGKRGLGHPDLAPNRLIPAWAGKTWQKTNCMHRRTAHPRVGGENHS